MDFRLKLNLLLLTAIGYCCAQTDVLPPKMSAVMGRNITFPLVLPEFLSVAWGFTSRTHISSPMYTKAYVNAAVVEKVGPKYNGRIIVNTTGSLQLGPLTLADSGTYEVIIVAPDLSQIKGETVLEVLEPVADVKITSNLSEAVEFNSTVNLLCSAKGSFLSYKWVNNSVPIVADGTHLIMDGNKLIITGVLRNDLRGPIYCTAQNELESLTSAAFNLSVSYGPENIAMTAQPADAVLKKGSNLTLSCSVQSSPAAEFTWFMNGVKLDQKTAVLALTNLEEKQSNYSCMAYNSKTLRYVTSQVTKVTVIEAISGTNISGPSSKLIAGNSTANLTCKASAGRADTVAWTKDGKPLASSDRIVFSPDQSVISILPVKKEDTGKYKCLLSNKVSTDSSTYEMAVIYGPDSVEIKGDKQVEVVDTVILKCSATSYPPAIYTWRLNDTLLEIDTSEYKIEKPDYKASGIYTCEAKNPVTQQRQTTKHTLIVKGEGEVHKPLSDGAVAAIVITVLLIVAIIIGVCIHKRKKAADIPSPY